MGGRATLAKYGSFYADIDVVDNSVIVHKENKND